jgi:LysM repeat protein
MEPPAGQEAGESKGHGSDHPFVVGCTQAPGLPAGGDRPAVIGDRSGGVQMRRRLATLLVVLGLVAACGGGATPTPAPSEAATPAPTDLYVPTEAPTTSATTAPTDEPTATPVSGKRYTVKKGDTMWQIAQDFGISLTDLKAANPDVDPKSMPVGTVLIIPGQ